MSPSLAVRSTAPEWMDDPAVDAATLKACLDELAVVNGWTRARPPTLAFLARALRDLPPGGRFSLLDVGYGQGDMLRAVHRWATRRGLVPTLVGIDLSPASAPAARAATPRNMAIDYRTGDLFELSERFDLIVSSLVAHHLTDDQLVAFLRWMEANAARGWFVNDLHRHAIAYHGFRALSTAMRWHPFVRHDGPLSVARSFRRADWTRLLAAANVTADVAWRLPFRLCVTRLK